MKKIINIFILAILSILTTQCADKESSDLDTNTNPKIKLGVYYFAGWSGQSKYDDGTPEHEWAIGLPTHATKSLVTEFAGREPMWGWREDTQEIMEQQIDLAADNGIAYFSFCWFWHNNKSPINSEAINTDSKHVPLKLFMDAQNNDKMEFCLLVANHSGYEIVGTEAWKEAADYWIENYFGHSRYLKVEGKPVIMIFSPNGADKVGLAYLQEAAKKAGYPGVLVAGCGNCSIENGFQVQTLYNTKPYSGLNLTDIYPFQLLADWNISTWLQYNNPDMPYIPVVTQGWDRRPWEAKNGEGLGEGGDVSRHFQRATPKEFEDYLKRLVIWMNTHSDQITKDRLAIIYAWNEMGEGGWLVPCKDDPDGMYLKAIKNVILEK